MPLETENLHRAVDLLKTLGKAYLSKNQYREATEKFENILRLGFKDADVYRHLAIALAGQKLYTPEAQRVYLWAVEKFPHDRTLCLHVAQAALQHQAEDDQASSFYFAALKFHPPFAKDLYLRLHAVFHRQGKYDESFQTLKQALYLEKGGADQLVIRLTQLGWRYDRTPELILTLQFLLGNNEGNPTIRRCLAFSLAHSLIRHQHQSPAVERSTPFNSETDLPLLRSMLPKPEAFTTLDTVREYCTLQLALLSASRSEKNFAPPSGAPSNPTVPKAFEYHSLLDALPLEDILAESPSPTMILPTAGPHTKTENVPVFDWHRDFLKFLPVANFNTAINAAAKGGTPRLDSLEVAALLILTPKLPSNPNGTQETLAPTSTISTSQALNLVTRHLQATAIAKRIYALSDGVIVLAASSEELFEASVTLLKKIAQYNSQVPEKDQINLRATLHGVPAEKRFLLSEENNSASNVNGLTLLYGGLHLLLADRDTPASSPPTQPDEWLTSASGSSLLISRKVFEALALAQNLTVKYWGNTYWGVPGWHDEVCELVWFNPLEYISEKKPYALERFLVLEKLQAQTTYDTYRTRDRTLERPVILKALRPEIYVPRRRDKSSHAETINTIRRLGRLEHPGIALIYDMGTHGDIFYFVREHIEGENLAQSFAKQQRLSPVEAVRLVLEICRILRYAHQNGVYHGNLKPSNIWRVKSSVMSEPPPAHARALLAPPPSQSEKITVALKIADFFIPGYHEITSSNWYYFPPELHLQTTNARLAHLRATSDIYALGMLLYDCLSGGNPFKAVSYPVEKSIWEEIQLTPFSVLTNNTTGLLPALDEVIQRATQQEPFQRQQTIDEFEEALRRVLKEPSALVKAR